MNAINKNDLYDIVKDSYDENSGDLCCIFDYIKSIRSGKELTEEELKTILDELKAVAEKMDRIEYKFYIVDTGCMGHIGNGLYRLFSTEEEYREWWVSQ